MAKSELSSLLRKKRIEKSITSRRLGKYLGFNSGQFIYAYEHGLAYPPLSRIKELSEILGVPKKDIEKCFLTDMENKISDILKKRR